MKRRLFLVALLMVFCVSGVNAADNKFSITATDGNKVKITNLGKMVGLKVDTEVATTSDTLTAAESGKTILANVETGDIRFTLPTAAAGLSYQFTSINGSTTATQGVTWLIPQSTDQFVGCVSSSSTTSFANGDRLYSPGATGDTLTIVGASTKWYCTNRIGTWVDGNQ